MVTVSMKKMESLTNFSSWSLKYPDVSSKILVDKVINKISKLDIKFSEYIIKALLRDLLNYHVKLTSNLNNKTEGNKCKYQLSSTCQVTSTTRFKSFALLSKYF